MTSAGQPRSWSPARRSGDIFRGNRAYDVVVWSVPDARDSVPDIQNLMIDTPSGQKIKLSDVATVALQPSPNSIDREDGSRHLDILADVEGVDIGTVGEELEDQLEAHDFPRGYHVELLGEFEEQQAAQNAAVHHRRHRPGGHLPASPGRPWAAGGRRCCPSSPCPSHWWAEWWRPSSTGGILSIGSLVGFFTVFGIAARNGILLISHAQHLEREEGETFGVDLVIRAAKERLAPILMTSLATGLALVPLVVFGQRPGQEIEHPLAVVILGGLFTSTLLSLFVIPALYLRFGKSKQELAAAGIGGPDDEGGAAAQKEPAGAPA